MKLYEFELGIEFATKLLYNTKSTSIDLESDKESEMVVGIMKQGLDHSTFSFTKLSEHIKEF
jgi:hypothetical protein